MTQATLTNNQPRRFGSCCHENANSWEKLSTFCKNNYLTRNQTYTLAKKSLVELIIYKGKYKARWAKGVNLNNYQDYC